LTTISGSDGGDSLLRRQFSRRSSMSSSLRVRALRSNAASRPKLRRFSLLAEKLEDRCVPSATLPWDLNAGLDGDALLSDAMFGATEQPSRKRLLDLSSEAQAGHAGNAVTPTTAVSSLGGAPSPVAANHPATAFAVMPTVTPNSGGQTFYVDPNGSNTNSGLLGSPWQTLQFAANNVAAGDTVIVDAGNYAGFDITTSGTSSAPISFIASAGVNITSPETMRKAEGINIEGASFIHLSGFTCDNMPEAGIRTVGFPASPTTQHQDGVVLTHNVCQNNHTWGIFTAFSDNVVITDNTCSGSVTQHGVYVSNTCSGPVVSYNTLFGNAGAGLHMNGDVSQGDVGVITNALVIGNVIFNNGTAGASGINCDGVQNSVIENNLLYNNHASGISLYDIDASHGSDNDVIVNNTIIMAAGARWCINIQDRTDETEGSINNTVFNNILLNNNTTHGSISLGQLSRTGFTSDYNIITTNANPFDEVDTSLSDHFVTFAQWKTDTGQDTHSFTATAAQLFVNIAGNDYHLVAGAPAIDAGVASLAGHAAPGIDLDQNGRPAGKGFDIGAYEFGSVPAGTNSQGLFFTDGNNQLWEYNSKTGVFTDTGGYATVFAAGIDAAGNPECWLLDGNHEIWRDDNGTFTSLGAFGTRLVAGDGQVAFTDGSNRLWFYQDSTGQFAPTGAFATHLSGGFDNQGNNFVAFTDASNQIWELTPSGTLVNTGAFGTRISAGKDGAGNLEIWYTDGSNQIWRFDNGANSTAGAFGLTIQAARGNVMFLDGNHQIWSVSDAGVATNTGAFANLLSASPATNAVFFTDGANRIWILQNGIFSNTGGFSVNLSAF
jgi:parallel beta-helix repeat protein